jgi:hypothetical protein
VIVNADVKVVIARSVFLFSLLSEPSPFFRFCRCRWGHKRSDSPVLSLIPRSMDEGVARGHHTLSRFLSFSVIFEDFAAPVCSLVQTVVTGAIVKHARRHVLLLMMPPKRKLRSRVKRCGRPSDQLKNHNFQHRSTCLTLMYTSCLVGHLFDK